MVKKVAVFMIMVLLVGAGAVIIKKKRAELDRVQPPARAPVLVRTARVERGRFPVTRRYLGTIRPKISVDIAPRITGRLFEVRFREGMKVRKGELLALIDDRQIRDRLDELKARLSAARTSFETQQRVFERDERLFEAKAVSQEQLDRSHAARDAARAEVVALEAALRSEGTMLSYSRLCAPFDGVITRRYQNPGDLAVPGRPVLAMEEPAAGYYVEIKIPQAEFAAVRPGARVRLLNGYPGPLSSGDGSEVIDASVSRIHPAVTTGTLSAVEADCGKPPFGLPTGAAVTAMIETGSVEGCKVPVTALLENVDSAHVFLVDAKGVVHVRQVRVLYETGDWAVVAAPGISTGDKVVVAHESALLRLHEGEKVSEVRREHGI